MRRQVVGVEPPFPSPGEKLQLNMSEFSAGDIASTLSPRTIFGLHSK
jgi:hypothetical protein